MASNSLCRGIWAGGTYEALAAEIVAQFIKNYDPKWERAWVAEKDGQRVGAVFVAKGSNEIAKVRLLHVEAEARGLGIGKRLVEEVSDSPVKRATRK